MWRAHHAWTPEAFGFLAVSVPSASNKAVHSGGQCHAHPGTSSRATLAFCWPCSDFSRCFASRHWALSGGHVEHPSESELAHVQAHSARASSVPGMLEFGPGSKGRLRALLSYWWPHSHSPHGKPSVSRHHQWPIPQLSGFSWTGASCMLIHLSIVMSQKSIWTAFHISCS